MIQQRTGAETMSAKNKLNGANFLGALLIAGLIFGVTGSLAVGVAFIGLVIAAIVAGDIRS
jgi:hypothetical protein